MFRHILMPTDGTLRSEAAIRFGMRLARAHGARTSALTVVDIGQRARARANLDFAGHVAKVNGVQCELLAEHGEKPYEHIVDAATRLGCDLIVMATHAREGLEALVLGSETQKVLARSKIPVVVCRE